MTKKIAVTVTILVVGLLAAFWALRPAESQAQGLVELPKGANAVSFAVELNDVGLVGWVVPSMLGKDSPESVLVGCQTWENKDGGLIQNVPLSMCGDDSNRIRPIPEGVVINGCALVGDTDCLAKWVPDSTVKDNAVIRCMQFENVEPGGVWEKIPKKNCLVPPPD